MSSARHRGLPRSIKVVAIELSEAVRDSGWRLAAFFLHLRSPVYILKIECLNKEIYVLMFIFHV
jgi:hypothetical protein